MDNKKIGIRVLIVSLIVIIIGAMLILFSKEDNKYKITFNNDGDITEVMVNKNETVSKPQDPVREGYTFEGWYYNGEKFDFTMQITEDMVLEARWTNNASTKWVVTFNSNGGNKIESLNVEDGKTIIDIPRPKKSGYKFIGWYNGKTKFNFKTTITGNITLTAKWEKIEVSDEPVIKKNYNVTFDTDGGSVVEAQKVEAGTPVIKPEDPTKEGWDFIGWYYDDAEYDFNTVVNGNITLIAKWKLKDIITYEIEKTDSYVGQIKIFVYKNTDKIDGLVDITLNTGEIIKDKQISKDGYITNIHKIKEITNVRES
ncbi:MAG: hypothetical protein E7165_00270 [Firmicutes bacterium]|nr:hypothetical protein [Bacillota bacterium]